MLYYADQINGTLKTAICIIGAGPAGITIANQLNNSQKEVVLLESGGFKFDHETEKLYEGHATGIAINDAYLTDTRFRYFGGNSNVWLGWCRPFDRYDFSKRSWVPQSGWPISYDEVKKYYIKAAEICNVAAFPENDDLDSSASRHPFDFAGDSESFVTRNFHIGPTDKINFGVNFRKPILESKNIKLVLNANCTEILTEKFGRAVKSVSVKTLGGKQFAVYADVFVLAAGAIENARLLLLSNSVHSLGIGNDRDIVGRYFMDHLRRDVGQYLIWATAEEEAFYRDYLINSLGQKTIGVLSTCFNFQKQKQTLNYCLSLTAPRSAEEQFEFAIEHATHGLDRLLSPAQGSVAPPDSRVIRGAIVGLGEQSPNPESRVTLFKDQDALGMRRVDLKWKISPIDFYSLYESTREIGKWLYKHQRGRIKLWIGPSGKEKTDLTGYHHMGTTRMSDHPSTGVVDSDCRVFGVDNLYVAGSSVFPTSGYANPTLTLVALALRLSEKLKEMKTSV